MSPRGGFLPKELRPSLPSGSSSESDKETDSSEHNGMTEGMWTESETDSRYPCARSCDVRLRAQICDVPCPHRAPFLFQLLLK